MRKDTPPPNTQRREMIDKGYIEPDPNRDGLTAEEWQAQDKFTTKVQQSWRRTMDDIRGRTVELEERAKDNPDRDR